MSKAVVLVAVAVILNILPLIATSKVFTKESLAKYNGEDPSLPIYLAIKGVVYDVSKGKSFYGRGGSYNVLAGLDCTRAVAKWSVEEEDLNGDISDLAQDELDGLENTIKTLYKPKYPVAGYMDYYKGDETNEL